MVLCIHDHTSVLLLFWIFGGLLILLTTGGSLKWWFTISLGLRVSIWTQGTNCVLLWQTWSFILDVRCQRRSQWSRMHRRIGQRGHKRISVWIRLAPYGIACNQWWEVGERMHLLLLFLLAFLLLAVLVRLKCAKEGDLLPLLAGGGGLGLGLQQVEGLAVLLCRSYDK